MAGDFTPGNLVVYRVGTGSGSLVNTGNPVFLDEFTPSGTLVQSIALPTVVNGEQKRLVASGTAASEGQMTLSTDGRFLILPGYDATPPHASSLTGTASSAVNRVIGRVDAAGVIDTRTALTDAFDANNFRGACSDTGLRFWVAGNGSSTTGGVRFVQAPGATTSTQLSTTNNNLRQPAIFAGQLHVSSGNGSTVRLGTVGAGLPATGGQTLASLPGYPVNLSPNAFVLLDLQTSVAGLDTLYIADDNTTLGGLLKYSFDGTTWTARGSAGAAADLYRGLTAVKQGADVILYAVRKGGGGATGGGEVVTLTDSSGSTGSLSGTPFLLATAASNTAFRGIAFAPQRADLTTGVSGPAGPLYTRRPFDLQVTVRNGGGGAAYQVGGSLTLPSGLAYVSDTAASAGFLAVHDDGVITFSGATLAAQSEVTFGVRVVTESAASYSFASGAMTVDPSGLVEESDESNNGSPPLAGLVVGHAADLKVSLGAPAQALTGAAGFEYTLVAQNDGLAEAPSVRVSLTLPEGLVFAGASGTGFTATEAGGVVQLDGSLAADSGTTLAVRVTAASDGTYTAAAGAAVIGAKPPALLVESDEANNSSTSLVATELLTCDLTLSNVASGTFQAGDGASYTITVSNVGTGGSRGLVTFSETLPAGLTATSITGEGWTIVQATGASVSATRSDSLAPGQSYPALTLQVSIATNAPASVTSTAQVSGGGDANAANDSAGALTTIVGAGPGVISIASVGYTVNEEDLSLSFELVRSSGRTGVVSVNVTTANGTAKAGADYTALSTVTEFADDEVRRTLLVPLLGDRVSEPNETFTITIRSPSGGAALGTVQTATVIILDPDVTAPRLQISHPRAGQRINEGPLTLTGEVTDNKQVKQVQVMLNDGGYVDADLTPVAAGRMTFALPVSPVPGLNELRMKASDFRGNETEEIMVRFTQVVKRPLTLVNGEGVSLRPAEPLTALELGKNYTLISRPAAGRVWNGWSSPQLTLTEAQRLGTLLNFIMTEGLTITAQTVEDPFLFSVVGDFSGLVQADAGVTPSHENEGALQIKVTTTGSFTGSLRIAGDSLPFAGVLDTTGAARFGRALETSLLLPRSPGAGFVLAFSVDLSPAGSRKITGTLRRQTRGGSEPLSVLEAFRHAGVAAEAFYTWAMPAQPQTNGLTSDQFPQGDGIGTLKLGRQGLASLAGVLADGTRITAGMASNDARKLPLSVVLEQGAGSLNGWLVVDPTRQDTDVHAPALHWFKPASVLAQHYPLGWPEGLTLTLLGTQFRVPEGESVLPDLSEVTGANALLGFSQGALSAPIQKELVISTRNVVTKVPANDPDLTIRLSADDGMFGGTFQHSDGVMAAYSGVILQKGANRRGFGHFLTATPRILTGLGQSGAVSLKTRFNPRLTLVISEFMANNESTIADEDGAYSDWIEIYNPGLEEVDLTDWCLTDNATTLAKWRFPAVTLGARQFLLVWASSKNRRTPGQPLHTNFNLAAGGEYLALVRPDGVTVDHEFSPMYPAQANDESYGINFTGRALVSPGAAVKYRLPVNASEGTAWTAGSFADSSWKSGRTGLGFGVGVPGFTVRQVAARPGFGGVNSIATCEALLALPKGHADILSEATVIAPTINYVGDGDDGNYPDNAALPNGTAEPYAFKATGILSIPVAGSYVFGLNSDDGGRIKIDNVVVMSDDTNHGPQNNLGAPVTLTAGPHAVEVIMWEAGGGDCVEFFAKAGTDTAWDAAFKLVGGPDGLPVMTTPVQTSGSVDGILGTNLLAAMRDKHAGCYLRLPFNATGVSSLTGLSLHMRYNDGFVAYLNGTEVARRNAPATPVFDSTATGSRSTAETLTPEVIDLSAQIPLLVTGRNVLAVHGMNESVSDSSFLILPELSATAGLAGNAVFFRPKDSVITATPGALNGVPEYAGTLAPLVFSQKHGFYQSAFSLAITSSTPGAAIRYTLDGSTPTATHGTLYSRPLSISRTSIVRAIGFRSGYEPTPVLTQSYFFLNDVIRQSAGGARPAAGWPAGTVNGQVSDYGMDPAVVNSTNPEVGGVDRVKSALRALPTVSIVTDLPNLFDTGTGIWINPYGRGEAWERPASVEMIGDSGPGGGFEINCGLRLRGGFSRSGDNPKHALRLFFRSKYGPSKLNYPLFGDEGVSSFDKIDLRTAQNYSWSFGGDGNNTFIREETTRELQGAMGQPYSRSRYYHLYLNGQYWGIYDTDERPEANFAESYIGGEADDYDTVKGEQDQGYITGVTDGNLDAWEALRIKARAHAADPSNEKFFALSGRAADGVSATEDPVLLEVDNLIDYMLLTFWTGNLDGATSAFLGDVRANNWFAVRNRLGTFGGFRFFAHDFEHTFFNIDEDRTGPFPAGDPTVVDTYNPMFIHHDLRPNAEYRMMWADRVQKHLFGGGALTASKVQERMRARRSVLDSAIIAESARWGDSKRGTEAPLTRLDWQSAVAGVIDGYVPERGSRVLAQLRADGLYPSFDAPSLSQDGGPITSGAEVVITGQGGTIYYTLDGSDPRQVGGALNPAAQTYASSTETTTALPLTQVWKYLADGSNQGTAWRAASFDDSAWPSGAAELGYGDGDEVTTVPFVDVDPGSGGDQKNATTYFRTSFHVADTTGISSVMLRVKYDDAVVLYLNGLEVAKSANIASNPSHNQYASGATPDEGAFVNFIVDPAVLVTGANVLAAEIHQADSASSDISFNAALDITRTDTPVPLYLTGTGSRTLKVRARSNGEWSALVEALFNVREASDMTVELTPEGTFSAGGTAAYTITARNVGTVTTSGLVTVVPRLPAGLTMSSLNGPGWNVTAQGTATRLDPLAPGASYPPLTLSVSIATTAPPLAQAACEVSGGGEINLANNGDAESTPVGSTGAGQILFSAAAYEAPEVGGSLAVTLLRTGSRAGSAGVRLRTRNGTARSPGDYDALDEVITFADGEASRTVDVVLNNDGRTELHESFTLLLSEVTGAASLGLPNQVSARILEPDSTVPELALLTPGEAARVVLPALTLTGTASDDKGLGRVEVSLNGGAFAEALLTPAAGASARWSLTIPASAGACTVRARAVDALGLISNEVVRSFAYVPLRPLSLTVTPAEGGEVSGRLPLLEVGQSYTLTARPAAGYLFDRWTGPGINREARSLSFTMTEGLALTAAFHATPLTAANAGTYLARVVPSAGMDPSQDRHGLIRLQLGTAATFSGSLKLGMGSHAFTGELHPGGGARFGQERTASLIIPRVGRAALVLSLAFDLSLRTFTGEVGEQTRGGDETQSVFSGARKRDPLAASSALLAPGAYLTRMIQLTPAAGTPGYPATAEKILGAVLARSGTLTLTGTLSDGSRLTASAELLEPGSMPLFDLLEGGAGVLSATLNWNEATPGFLATDGQWFKPVLNQGAFPFGWPEGLTFRLEGGH
jgi:uncharacterized repeat protein (TIGR01451 family)